MATASAQTRDAAIVDAELGIVRPKKWEWSQEEADNAIAQSGWVEGEDKEKVAEARRRTRLFNSLPKPTDRIPAESLPVGMWYVGKDENVYERAEGGDTRVSDQQIHGRAMNEDMDLFAQERADKSWFPRTKSTIIQGATDLASLAKRTLGYGEAADFDVRMGSAWAAAAEPYHQQSWSPLMSRAVSGAGRTIPSMVVSGAVGGPYAAIGLASASEANQASVEGRDAGLEGAKLAGYVARAGTIEAVPAIIMQRIGFGGVEKLLGGKGKAAVVKGLRQGWKQGTKEVGKGVAEELTEEVIFTEIPHLVNRALSDVDPNALSAESIIETVKQTVAQTIVTYGVVSSPNVISARATGRKRAERLALLKAYRAKGFVSEEDGRNANIPGVTRKERTANADAEIEQLEVERRPTYEQYDQETQDASAVPTDQGSTSGTGIPGTQGEVSGGRGVREQGPDTAGTEAAVEGTSAAGVEQTEAVQPAQEAAVEAEPSYEANRDQAVARAKTRGHTVAPRDPKTSDEQDSIDFLESRGKQASFVDVEGDDSLAGLVDTDTGFILLRGDRSSADLWETVGHEVAHETGLDKTIPADSAELAEAREARLARASEASRKRLEADPELLDREARASLVGQFMRDKNFRDKLARSNPTLWEKIRDVVLKTLGKWTPKNEAQAQVLEELRQAPKPKRTGRKDPAPQSDAKIAPLSPDTDWNTVKAKVKELGIKIKGNKAAVIAKINAQQAAQPVSAPVATEEQAADEEAKPGRSDYTGVKVERVNAQADAAGLPRPTEVESVKAVELVTEAIAKLTPESDLNNQQLAADVVADQKPISVEELADLLASVDYHKRKADEADDRYNEAMANGEEAKAQTAEVESAMHRVTQHNVTQAARDVGRRQFAYMGHVLQVLVDKDGEAHIESVLRKSQGGRLDESDAEWATKLAKTAADAKKIADGLRKAKKEQAKRGKEIGERESEAKADEKKKELEGEVKRDRIRPRKTRGSSNRIVTQKKKDAAVARWNQGLQDIKTTSGALPVKIPLEMLKEAAIVGAYHVEARARQFAEFSRAMIEELGAGIEPHLANLHRDAMAEHARNRQEKLRERLKDADGLKGHRRSVTALAKEILAETRKEDGSFITRDELLDLLHAELEQIEPGITRREAMDILSGHSEPARVWRDTKWRKSRSDELATRRKLAEMIAENEWENMDSWQTTGFVLKRGSVLHKALMTGLDLGAHGIQLGVSMITNPIVWSKALLPTVRAISAKQAELQDAEREAHPKWEYYKDLGVALSDSTSKDVASTEFYGNDAWIKKFWVTAVSARTFHTAINEVRFNLMQVMEWSYTRKGHPLTQQQGEAIARMVNTFTLAYKPPKDGRIRQKMLDVAAIGLWAPSMYVARVQLVVGAPLWLNKGADSRVRQMAAMQYIKATVGMAALTAALRMLLGDDEDRELLPEDEDTLNPTDPDFYKVKVGNVRMDMTAGVGQMATLGARSLNSAWDLYAGEPIWDTERRPRGTRELTGQFTSFKAAPWVSMLWDLTSKTDALGRPNSLANTLLSNITPLSVQAIVEGVEEEGAAKGAALAVPAVMGKSPMIYGDLPKSEETFLATVKRLAWRMAGQQTPGLKQDVLKKYLENTIEWDTDLTKAGKFLTPTQLKEAKDRKAEKQELVTYWAFFTPNRKDYITKGSKAFRQEAYDKRLEEVNKALETFKEMGITHDEAQKLLVEHFWRPTTENSEPTDMGQSKSTHHARAEALAKFYDMDEKEFSKWWVAFHAKGGKRSELLDEWKANH